MADAAEIITGPARDWLAAKRADLNARFRLAQRRYAQLNAESVLALCRELLPPLAGDGEKGSNELLANVYNLILLHAGRGTLAPGGGSSPGIGELLRSTFPLLRSLLLARPSDLPAALSNAVENLGARGIELARGLAGFVDYLTNSDDLLNAGALLAWRLGEARLRAQALAKAERLPAPVVRSALNLAGWPDEAMPLAIAGLLADGWRRPDELIGPETLAQLPKQSPQQRLALAEGLALVADKSPKWRPKARLGNFRGFDGHFDQPPVLLDSGTLGGRHRFWAKSGDAIYRLDADVFGWVCRLDPSVDFPALSGKKPERWSAALPAKPTSIAMAEHVLAITVANSFRVRLFTPARRPL